MSAMLEKLAEVLRLYDDHQDKRAAEDALELVLCHPDEISQNADAAKRLKALEQAMKEAELDDYQDDEMNEVHHRAFNEIHKRAAEIVRGEG